VRWRVRWAGNDRNVQDLAQDNAAAQGTRVFNGSFFTTTRTPLDWKWEFKPHHTPVCMLSPDYTMHVSIVRLDCTLSHTSRRQ
jgi:hypothetical protein